MNKKFEKLPKAAITRGHLRLILLSHSLCRQISNFLDPDKNKKFYLLKFFNLKFSPKIKMLGRQFSVTEIFANYRKLE